MNAFSTHPTALTGAALGFFAMTLVGWKMADQPQRQVTVHEEKTARAANRPERHVRKSGPSDAVRQRVAAIRAISSPDQRMRATIEFANSLPASEIGAWIDGRWFNTGGGFDLTLFNKILTERWKKEDPDGMLAWNLKNNTGRTSELLASLADSDPQKLLDFFKEHPNKDQQLQALAQIAKKNPAFALQCLRDLPPGASSEDGMSGYYNRQVLAELAKSSPAALEAALATLSPSLKKQAEAILIGQKLQTSFNTEFQKLIARPDGWEILSSNLSSGNGGLGDKIFDQLASLPAEWRSSLASNAYSAISQSNATKWWNADLEGLGFSDSDAKRLRQVALSRISRDHPDEAIKLLGTSGFDANSRQNVISNIFSNFSGNPEKADKAEALIALLGSDEEKQQARNQISTGNDTEIKEKIEKPADWLEKVSALDLKKGNSYQYLSMLGEWDPDKIAELGNQFRTMPDDKKKQVAEVISGTSGYSARYVSTTLQGDAIRYLVAQPPDSTEGNQSRTDNTLAQASQFAVNWSKTDPTAASDWVGTLPAGDAKTWAQKNLAANWAQYDPQATQQWLKSLPAGERTAVQDFMKNGGKN
jgi:hypothetical protein